MTALQTSRTMPLAGLLLGGLLTLALLALPVWGAVDTATDATVDVADLERLVQQLQDPPQREQFIKTLQALLATAKLGHSKPAGKDEAGPLLKQSQGLFFAYGKLTEHLSEAGRNLGRSLASLPVMLLQLPERLTDSSTQRMLTSLGVTIGILLALGVMLQALASRLEARLRTYAARRETRSMWKRGACAPLVIGLAIMPYVALFVASGIVFSIFPVGPVPSGLTALVIATLICYRLARTLALVLLNPEEPPARLLPISDSTAHAIWTWALRVIRLSAAYYLITHTLLTIGVSEEVYAVVRGAMIIAIALVLSVIVLRLMLWQRKHSAAAVEGRSHGFWPQMLMRLQPVWPIIALAYIWCTAFFALATFQHGTTYMVTASVQTVVVIGACFLLLWVGDFLHMRAVAFNDRLGHHLPGFEIRTRRYLQTSWAVIRCIIILAACLLILQAWGVWTTWFFTSPIWSDVLTRLVILLVTFVFVGLVVDFSTFASRKFTEAGGNGIAISRKRKTLIPLLGTTVKYAALAIGGLVALQQLGVNITPILAGMGIVSLAVGFGAQTLVKDIINGLFMLFEDSLGVGDVVTIKGTGGLVEAVNLRTLRLRDLDGRVHVIPNSQVEVISNMTKDFSYYVLDVNVAYREDTDEVIALLREIDEGMRHDVAFAADMLEPIDIMGVDRFADSAVVIRARLKTKPIRQWYVGREFNRRMKKVFDEHGIEIPFPAQTIYWGQPKEGTALPLQLYVQNLEGLSKTAPGDRQAFSANENIPDGK
jgi:small conductance mechanosensitive channel